MRVSYCNKPGYPGMETRARAVLAPDTQPPTSRGARQRRQPSRHADQRAAPPMGQSQALQLLQRAAPLGAARPAQQQQFARLLAPRVG